MARYLLLEFEHNDQARALINRVEEHEASSQQVRVLGLYAKPTDLCNCGPLSDLEQRRQIRRDSKFGWWYHRLCKKARSAVQQPNNLHPHPAAKQDYYIHLAPAGLTIARPRGG